MENKKNNIQYFEKYFDVTYQLPYYYDVQSGQSCWELPKEKQDQLIEIIDKTDNSQIQKNQQQIENNEKVLQIDNDNEISQNNQSIVNDNKKEEYKKRQEKIKKLQQENLLAIQYPEYYLEKTNNSRENDDQIDSQQNYDILNELNSNEIANLKSFDDPIEQINNVEMKLQNAEQDFRNKMIQKTQKWLQRPARKQIDDVSMKNAAYVEGNYDYNIWYDKFLTDRQERYKKTPAKHRCDIEKDAGFTKADSPDRKGNSWFCLYFTRGHCTEGSNCNFFHRVPNHDDCIEQQDNLKDIFGRSRYATHKDNMTGIGSFNVECRTIFLTGINLLTQNQNEFDGPIKSATASIYDIFSQFGEIEDIAVSKKASKGGPKVFIKYSHRYYAEFAREAMNYQIDIFQDQKEPMIIKWALQNSGNPLDVEGGDDEKQNFEIEQIREQLLKKRSHQKINQNQKQISIQYSNSENAEKLLPQISSIVSKREIKKVAKYQKNH